MMFAWSPLSRKRRSVTWLMLLVLAGVNSVLAWHQAAHAFEQLAIEASSNPAQTAAQLGDHCDLCLSAHGYNSGPVALVFGHWQAPHVFQWESAAPVDFIPSVIVPQQARAPPFVI